MANQVSLVEEVQWHKSNMDQLLTEREEILQMLAGNERKMRLAIGKSPRKVYKSGRVTMVVMLMNIIFDSDNKPLTSIELDQLAFTPVYDWQTKSTRKQYRRAHISWALLKNPQFVRVTAKQPYKWVLEKDVFERMKQEKESALLAG